MPIRIQFLLMLSKEKVFVFKPISFLKNHFKDWRGNEKAVVLLKSFRREEARASWQSEFVSHRSRYPLPPSSGL